MCTNTDGSYKCYCNSGFRLKRDGLTCEGKIMIVLNHGFHTNKPGYLLDCLDFWRYDCEDQDDRYPDINFKIP